ncbi:helix-turn-helix domain containing protein [Methylobacterium sp. J-072]|uniref:helix-turn-helix domain-containing protein n=1 Tax=Methylobacterium sp. J-072 TaxID=2836651 RepID=UPI001FBAE6D4|nr:helix-turn-helix domain-containing protein [Methylobacterium sp. J-072]MCJ2091475.1 helix-turn-helix domain containing protein [Methylobacterium sp. J-072]
MTATEIAKKYGISTASVYRWQRQSDDIQRAMNSAAPDSQIRIADTLLQLCGDKDREPAATQEALFQLLCWIRWPSEPGFHAPAMINCITSYAAQKLGSLTIADLDQKQQDIIYKYLTLDLVKRLSSPQAAFNPDFEIVTNTKSRYDDRQFYAQIINYLIYNESSRTHSRRRRTLEKLKTLVEAGAFGPDWSMSRRTFEHQWRSRACTFPFLYVEQYHSPFDWSLNPQDDDFAESVDEIVSNLADFPVYLGQVRGVMQQLHRVLDPRATRFIAFPKLPGQVVVIPTVAPELSANLRAKINELIS